MIDLYDQEHSETGSSNISKASSEWSKILEEARIVQGADRPDDYVLHVAYDLIHSQVRHGIAWNKCGNCGTPYRLDSTGAAADHCSSDCFNAVIADLLG